MTAPTAASSMRLYRAREPLLGRWLLLGHGAGAGQESGFMVSFAEALAERGVHVATFNFLYTEQHRRLPDRSPMLEACCLAAIRHLRALADGAPIFIGGKSMGGRIASQVAAAHDGDMDGLGVAGLVFFGYPLHPPGKPGQLRVGHWPQVRLPALFVQGSRDAFGTPDEIRGHLSALAGRADLHVVEGGDHSFKVARIPRERQALVFADVQDTVARWIAELA